MDPDYRFPNSTGMPLFAASPERVNIQRSSAIYDESSRESSVVHDKVQAFNSLASQGKILERKTADAALKRAQLGREQAESESSRLREELRESQRRERKVAERMEAMMENFGKHKEHYEHTKTVWEKEIKKARKESFKQNSHAVKLQEELKSCRSAMTSAQGELTAEKERSMEREQEAFAARYQLVGVQEELSKMQESIKLVGQERDALRTIAKNEEIARIAAEGRIPLPHDDDEEFASPKKERKVSEAVVITRSAASEEELDNIRMLLEWEQHRAKRAHDRVEFLEVECRLNVCSSRSRLDPQPEKLRMAAPSTVFVPSEGVFRTVDPVPEESPWISPAKKQVFQVPAPRVPERTFARTPSCEPPSSAIPPPKTRASLQSLLDAPSSPSPASSPVQESSSPSTNTTDESTLTNIVQTFHTISTTTRIPLAPAPDLTPIATTLTLPVSKLDALSPTMSREEALAQIRERRGRARSLAQGTMTPRKQMVEGADRRDISAPAIRSGGVKGRNVLKGI